MGYIEQNLLQGEVVVFKTRLSLFALILNALTVSALAAIIIFVLAESMPLSIILFVASVFFTMLRAFIIYSATDFAVTNKRIVVKNGLLLKNTSEWNLQKLESMQLKQRPFGYSSIVIVGSGGTKGKYQHVARAKQFRDNALRQSSTN